MKEQNMEKSPVRKLVALLAAIAVGFGVTLTGCAPQDSEEPALPEEPAAPEGENGMDDSSETPMPEENGNGG